MVGFHDESHGFAWAWPIIDIIDSFHALENLVALHIPGSLFKAKIGTI